MNRLAEQWTQYLPDCMLARLCDKSWSRLHPVAVQEEGAVMLIDISGFTPLTRRLIQNGASGLEQLTVILNTYFGAMTARIRDAGGQTVQFAGDALLAVWPAPGPEAPLRSALEQAALCGLRLQQLLHHQELFPDLQLSLRITVSAGSLTYHYAGGVRGRWDLVLSGDAIRQMSACGGSAEPGKVLLSPEAYTLLDGSAYKVEPVPGATAGVVIRAEMPLPEPAPLAAAAAVREPEPGLLSPYLPPAVWAAVTSGQGEWAAELRHVTVLFIHLPEFHIRTGTERLHQAIEVIQNVLLQQDAAMNKISLDDKGIAVIAALGLPSMTHEDDTSRALAAGLALHAHLAKLGVRASVGIATGPVFCGSIGSEIRREYTMIGDTMNLAARLMQAADGAILCDEATRRPASGFRCEARGTLSLKGFPEPVRVYQPVEAVRRTAMEPMPDALIGRLGETGELWSRMQILPQGAGGAVLITGEAGMGKSRLLHAARAMAEELRLRVLSGAADSIDRLTPYYPWRQLFHQALGTVLDRRPEQAAKELLEKVRSLLPAGREPLLPLLNAVLPLGLKDNDRTVHMAGRIRADNTQSLLAELLHAALGTEPAVVILDDVHWMDSASWSMLLTASRHLPTVLFILAMRPEPPDQSLLPAEYRMYLEACRPEPILLEGLSESDTVRLICERLGVASLPEEAVKLIWSKTEGHPLFSEELAYSLRDRGFLEIDDGTCRMRNGSGSLQDVLFNPSIQGIIMSRIDRLPAKDQLVLKVASVIGRLFTCSFLLGILPYRTAEQEIKTQLTTLEEVNLTVLESLEPDLSYLFRHILTQEVTYNMLLRSQRKQLHQAAAEWLESRGTDLSPYYSLLAHHWSKAENTDKAVGYLEQVGLQAMKTGAYPEAVHAFRELLALVPDNAPIPHTARWHRLLGEACMGVGDMAEAYVQLKKALALFGKEPASTAVQFVQHTGKQLLLQLLHRLRPARYFGRLEGRSGDAPELARCYFRLSEIAFFTNKPKDNIYHSLHGLNLGEETGASVELAQITGNMCVTAGIVSLHRLARAYKRQAFQVAEMLGDPVATAWVNMDCSLYHIGIGEWESSSEYAQVGMAIYERLGDRRYWEACSYLYVKVLCYRDADFEASSRLAAEIYDSGSRSGNVQAKSWGLMAQAENRLYQGRPGEALPLLLEAEGLIPANIGLTEEIRVYSQLACTHLRLGQRDQAKSYAARALASIRQSSPTAYYAYDAYAALAEAYLELWAGSKTGESTALRRDLHTALRALKTFAGVFPIAKPRYLRCRGALARLEGALRKAARFLRQSRELAEQLRMPHEAEQARLELEEQGRR
ncbi:AAA family ATPase [Gorillibacterium sp. sgz5001074]|uniref:AAA family ATPase n=1 Tax=Gorillibacterium sp. sgz5001074 TaxID=3446695 RepID=UPI003F66C1F4